MGRGRFDHGGHREGRLILISNLHPGGAAIGVERPVMIGPIAAVMMFLPFAA
jgi:hypothetical protein